MDYELKMRKHSRTQQTTVVAQSDRGLERPPHSSLLLRTTRTTGEHIDPVAWPGAR